MNPFKRIAIWLDVRPHEARSVLLSFLGAFAAMAFLILARSLREALYLTSFPIESLPYITAAVALLSVPAVGIFVRLLSRHHPKQVLMATAAVLAAGLLVLWPLTIGRPAAVVAFYIWTALGTVLLTSGFWVVTSELFAIRGAKRLFGLIGAGGTAGAMLIGISLAWLVPRVELEWLIPGLVGLIVLFLVVQQFLPEIEEAPKSSDEKSSLRDSMRLVWDSPHLRTIAAIVFVIAVATTLLDYQFKDLVRTNITTTEGLTSFFGAFYGWTGGVALLIQLLVVARFLAVAGVAWSLAVLPLVLLLGSAGVLVVPGLVLVTLLRGSDASLRKSLYRSALEILYVPVPSLLRRKTKTFIDSVVDSLAEGLGAGIIFLWVTLSGFSPRYLSVFIIVLSLYLLHLSRRMGLRYFETVTEGLKDSGEMASNVAAAARLGGRDLLSGTFTRLDIRSLIEESDPGLLARGDQEEERAEDEVTQSDAEMILARLNSADLHSVARTLEETTDWEESHIPVIIRLLARDALFDRARLALMTIGDPAVPLLTQRLVDESTDFVIRRRIPRVLARMGGVEADDALIEAVATDRFEVRYRAAIALVRRRRRGLPVSQRDEASVIWGAIRSEIGRGRPVWEMQKLLDDEPAEDELVQQRVGARGELSLEHTFRLLTLVLEPEVVRAAFNGIILEDEKLKSFSLEYLEQALPADVRKRLWPFIGDVSEYQREKSLRPLDDVVSDLMKTGATLFGDAQDREALKRLLDEEEAGE